MTVPAHILAAATVVPASEKLEELRKKAQEWYDLDSEIARLETTVAEKKVRSLEIQTRELPDMFAAIGVDVIGLPEANVDVKVENYYKASIAADWPQDDKNRAYGWLEDNGHGSLIKVTVSVDFGKGEIEKARELQELIRQSPIGNTHPVDVSMGVNWNTLTSFVKERLQAGDELPMETLGAKTGRIAKIKKRKEK